MYSLAHQHVRDDVVHQVGRRPWPRAGLRTTGKKPCRLQLNAISLSCPGRVLGDLKKVNYVVLGGENAGEHLFI